MGVSRGVVGFEDHTPVVMMSSISFPRNMSPPSFSRALLASCFHFGFLHGLFFNPEGGGNMLL
jgi:hypothetical protein